MRIPTPTTPEPERIARLPKYKGLPVTATTRVDESGVPNFKEIDGSKVWQFKQECKCAICGEPLDYWVAFMVTEEEVKTRHIYESPQHIECLRYAFQLCPWLYYSKAMYSPIETVIVGGRTVSNSSHPERDNSLERPSKLGIYICRSYENVIIKPKVGGVSYRVCKAAPAKTIEWIEGK